MNNPWKLATLGLALTGVTALSTGLTTAYLVRPTARAEATVPSTAPARLAYAPAPARAAMQSFEDAGSPAVATPASVAPAPVTPALVTPVPVTPAPVATRIVRTAAVQTVADDCSTGGKRAMKIAKPGLIGTLAGAGLGAVGGAIANGGSGAGKGALIGGIAGAALGGGYGAYKTKQECGTIFGGGPGFASGATQAVGPIVAPQSALRAAAPAAGNGITVYNAR